MTTTLNPVAVTSADLLRAIDAGAWATRSELAESVGRKPNNISRDLGVLEAAGLISIDPDVAALRRIALTETGKAQLAAIGRAEHGGERRKSRGRAPLNAFVPNPANRQVTDHSVQVMADTIEAVGDVLERIKATPADATGVRMLLDGETRWRAVGLLTEQGRLPEALAEGIPFEEREATDAEQILIRIVTASARTDLSPLDDARQLLALQEATGWSAREIAKKTGRSPADSDTGVRDVQVKIKVAREAAPFFLAQYALDGSWDRLRDSVTQPKPRLPPEQELSAALAAHGTAALGAPPADPAADPDGDAKPSVEPGARHDRCAEEWVLVPPWKEEPAHALNVKHDRLAIRLFSHPEGRWFASLDTALYNHGGGMGESYTAGLYNPPHSSRIEALKAARKRALERHPNMPAAFRDWLDQQLGPFYVNGVDRLNASNAGEARRALGWDKRHANSGAGKSADPSDVELKPSTQRLLDGFKAAPGPAPEPAPVPPSAAHDLTARAVRMDEAARSGTLTVLLAALSEIIEAADSHLSGLRRNLEQAGQDLTEFEEDTSPLREAMTQALDAVDGLGLGEGDGVDPVEPFSRRLTPDAPFVPVRKSITPEHITCLEDGRRFAGGLRRHLLTRHNLTPEQYREKWGLPADYPMVAPNHAKRQYDALRDAALRSAARPARGGSGGSEGPTTAGQQK